MLEIKQMTLRSVASQYKADKKIRIIDNGKQIFMGVAGAINKSFKAPTLDRTCDVFEGRFYANEDETFTIYLQRKAK